MKSSKTRFLCLFLSLVYAQSRASSLDSVAFDSAQVSLAFQRYDEAVSTLGGILSRNPGNIDALYLQLATHQTRILDYESYLIRGDHFLRFADSVLHVLESARPLRRGADSVRCLFYIGNVHGGKSVINAKCDRWLPAVRDALTSTGILRQVRKLDPHFYEARLGTGVFKYYLSNDLKWVPGVSNRAHEGLADIQLATRARFPYDLAAKDLLCWILIDRGEYKKADSVAQTVLDVMPDNSIFLRIRAQVSLKMQRWTNARELSLRLVAVSRSRTPVNWSDLLMGYRILSEYYDYHQKGADVRELKKEIGALSVPEEYLHISHIRDHYRRIKEVGQKYARGS